MNNLLYAKYTITLYDLLELEPTFLDFMQLDCEEHTNKFKEIFSSKWGMYEIGGETPQQFKIFLLQDFKLHKDYYIEKINMYEKDFKLTEGVVSTLNSQNTNNKTGNVSTNETQYGLPNKETSNRYPTSKSENSNTRNLLENDNFTQTIKGQLPTYEIKERALATIRNIYEEFAERFKECFILLY